MTNQPATALQPHQAVVIGASVAGLLAARVLADHFTHVLVIERDRFGAGDAPRKGVPQGQHIHVLLARGREILNTLFPGLQDELAAAGAPPIDFVADVAVLGPAGWVLRVPSNLSSHTCTRPLLEARIRARLLANPQVRFREGCDVVGLLADGSQRVTGVRLRERGQTEGVQASTEEVHADLVVDASGRTSAAPHWLQMLGYAAPQETVINAFLGYASRLVEPPSGFQPAWKGLYIQCAPPAHLRGGLIWPVEGQRWMVSLLGMGRDYPPTDEAGFLAFARSLRTPQFYEAIKDVRPLAPIAGYRATENRLRHYERFRAWPDGFVVVGDAVCAFNPVYGQGMSVAAISALLLDSCLREQRNHPEGGLAGMSRRFQHQLARSNTSTWKLASGADLRGPVTEGARPSRADQLMYRYLDHVFERATADPHVLLTLGEVIHLRKPPSTLFHPRIVWSILAGKPRASYQIEPAQ